MAQPRDWLYFLTDEQGRSYRVNNGIVEAVSTPTPLPITPDGWQEKSIKYNRSSEYFGLFRTFTTPLKYIKDAAKIVRDKLYRTGTETKLYQVIHRLDKSFLGGWVHRFFYKGELDLSQTNDEDTNVAVNIMEGDLSKLLKANENTAYEIDIDVPEAVPVKMDGHYLKGNKRYVVIEPVYNHGSDSGVKEMIPMVESTDEGHHFNIFFKSDAASITDADYSYIQGEDLTNSAKYNGWVDENVRTSFHMEGSIFKHNVTPFFARVGLDVKLETNTGRVINLFTINLEFPAPGTTLSFSVTSAEIELLQNERFFIYTVPNAFQNSNQWDWENNVIFEYKTLDKYKTTYAKGLRPIYVAQKLLDKITGGGYTFTSTFLSTEWENLLITSGDELRGLPNAKLKISWSDFFSSYNVPCNLCAGIRNQQLFIEKKADAFQTTIQQALGAVRDMKVSTSKDFQYNRVNIGYPNTDTEDVNGRDEFNVTQVYTSPITRINKALDLVSKIRASMYEIEFARVAFVGKDTTDDRKDERVFFLHVEKTPTTGTGDEPATYYKLLRNTYDSVTGLISPSTAFNLELHPELCLRRHGNFMRSIFYWQEAGYLVRETSDKNADVVVIKAGVTYIGNKNTLIGSLETPLFIPIVFKVEGPMPSNTIETMDVGPDGTFSWEYDGFTHYGFPMEVGIQPANRPAQETTLLCSPQTNILNLITISR